MTDQKQDQEKSKITRKDLNYFSKKVECWNCNDFYHRAVITKYHGILCKKCYQTLHEEANRTFFFFVGALGLEFDSPLEEETKTLEDTIETMHNYWKTYVVVPDYDVIEFEKCYLKYMKAVKDIYEMIENYNI
jgi:hypothetical protein